MLGRFKFLEVAPSHRPSTPRETLAMTGTRRGSDPLPRTRIPTGRAKPAYSHRAGPAAPPPLVRWLTRSVKPRSLRSLCAPGTSGSTAAHKPPTSRPRNQHHDHGVTRDLRHIAEVRNVRILGAFRKQHVAQAPQVACYWPGPLTSPDTRAGATPAPQQQKRGAAMHPSAHPLSLTQKRSPILCPMP
jgi:hypothetical protein